MAKEYNIPIVDGIGSKEIASGNYNVTGSASGYDSASLSPQSVSITDNVITYHFTMKANGTLTLHVTEEGTSTGTPIEGATFVRIDKHGTTYGTEMKTNASGNLVLSNVPFGVGSLPVYYKQTGTNENHTFTEGVRIYTLSVNAETVEIANPAKIVKNITLTDATHQNLPIENGEIILKEQ